MTQSALKILLVEDDEDTLEFLRFNLECAGFAVDAVQSGEEALDHVHKEIPELIVLDIMLPGQDGVEICRQFREMSFLDSTIIVFLTARGENYSEIAGFEAGADDYIVKPIKPRVFVTRIKALLKRKKYLQTVPVNEAPDLAIDEEKMIAIKDGQIINWQNKEFKLLLLLSSKPGKVFSREEIFNNVWGNNHSVGQRIIDVYIRRIREKIGSEHIGTVIGKGYKFII